MKGLRAALAFSIAALVAGCNEQPVEVELRSLQASTEVTFVCIGSAEPGGPDLSGVGLSRGACASSQNLRALVTQTATNEIAVVNVATSSVVDIDPSIPGKTFLRLPSRPGDIVSTPGGTASFVGLTTLGKTGISAIPSTCLDAPEPRRDNTNEAGAPSNEQAAEPPRDLTLFPACRLPTAPGDMAVLIEPPNAEGTIGTSCTEPSEPEPPRPAEDRIVRTSECPKADLTTEDGPRGRRKLAVALPDLGQIVVIDAQELLGKPPGSFEPCRIEATLTLSSEPDPRGETQVPPPELELGDSCELPQPVSPPAEAGYVARPAGFALHENRLYVADLGAPLVHVIDVTSACNLRELPPLLPQSFENPARVPFTSRVAASPLTPSGKRFVYAVDVDDYPTASVMAFDVSPGSTDRTPIVRPGSVRLPLEPADRIQFSAPITDVAFALRDIPYVDVDGVARSGVYCDPDPAIDEFSAAAKARPRGDLLNGARPDLLRGLFGLAMMTTGQIAIIDVDDFDAPCRRPRRRNVGPNEDFSGCANDPPPSDPENPDFELRGRATVTDEISCNMVEPHRVRAAQLGSSLAAGAPSLVALPQFTSPDLSTQPLPRDRPKLLAVQSPGPDGVPQAPDVFVGTTRYELELDPNTATQSSLVLPFNQPRTYPGRQDRTTLTYEGTIIGGRLQSGFVQLGAEPGPNGEYGVLRDANASFCDRGVYDRDALRSYAEQELGVPAEHLDSFVAAHLDYVQITAQFPPPLDLYWHHQRERAAAGETSCSFGQCEEAFGSSSARDLNPGRELEVVRAFQDRLEVAPRGAASPEEAAARSELMACCFPSGSEYTLRAGGQWVVLTQGVPSFRHDVVGEVGAEGARCVRDCDPRKRFQRSRVFEIASSVDCAGNETCAVGLGNPAVDACLYTPVREAPDAEGELVTRGVELEEPAAACILENLTARFAVYRGALPSTRDMRFLWDTRGGFVPMTIALTTESAYVLPQRVDYLPELEQVVVVDAASLGLSLVSLDTLRIEGDWPVF